MELEAFELNSSLVSLNKGHHCMLMAYIRAYDFYGAGQWLVLRKIFAFPNGMVFFTEQFSAVFQPFSGHICVPPILKVTK